MNMLGSGFVDNLDDKFTQVLLSIIALDIVPWLNHGNQSFPIW